MELCISNRFVKPGRGHRRWRYLIANLYGSWLWSIWFVILLESIGGGVICV